MYILLRSFFTFTLYCLSVPPHLTGDSAFTLPRDLCPQKSCLTSSCLAYGHSAFLLLTNPSDTSSYSEKEYPTTMKQIVVSLKKSTKYLNPYPN